MNIIDSDSGLALYKGVVPVTAEYASVADAYSAWAAEIGVSDTVALAGLVNADDACGEVTLNFIPTLNGASYKAMVSSEGSFGIYLNEPGGSAGSNSRPITGISGIHQNVTRNYNSRTTNPALIINCKHPTNDSKSANAKWQQTADTAIFYVEWMSYSSTAKQTRFAIRLRHGEMTIVCDSVDTAGAYVQFFQLSELATTSVAIAGDGNYSQAMTVGELYQFNTLPLKHISGTVLGADSLPYAGLIRVHDRATGALAGETIADGTTGEYSVECTDGAYYVVCFDDTATAQNALIYDRVVPVE